MSENQMENTKINEEAVVAESSLAYSAAAGKNSVKDNTATFTEDSIRPDAMMTESDRIHAEDLKNLLTKESEFVEVNCPACETAGHEPFWKKDGFNFVQCSQCETVFLNPRPTSELLADYYATAENYNFWSKEVFPASENVRREKIVKPRVARLIEICTRQGIESGVLIEVGAGYGTFCEEVKDTGYFERVIAIEPTPSWAQSCRDRGLEVIELPVEKLSLQKESADVVASFEVIEHLFSPKDFVTGCASLLKTGGLLILSCPNLKGFDVVTLGAVSQVVDAEHLNYFHPESFAHLLESCGMEVLELFTPGKLDAEIVRKRAAAGLIDLSSQPFLQQVLVDDWDRLGNSFQEFLADNNLSSHMWAVAQKK